MSLSDYSIKIILVFVILTYLAVLASGLFTGKRLPATVSLNSAAGLFIIGYWMVRQTQISQHIVETRELVILFFEALVIICGFCYFRWQSNNLLTILEYVFFGLHFTALLLFTAFMYFFEFNRLI